MIRVTELGTSRTWVIRIEVDGAPDTKRAYSDHVIRPHRLDISYLATSDGQPHVSSVHLIGNRVSPSGTLGGRLTETWHSGQPFPAWISPLIRKYLPS